MNLQTDAHIYIAEQRGLTQTDWLKSFHTFNFGPYVLESRRPFGALELLNDDTLLAGASLSLQTEKPTEVILLPIAGGLEYRTEQASGFLVTGQAVILSLPVGATYGVSNPYETEYINFLQIWLTNSSPNPVVGSSQSSFDLTLKNTLLPVVEPATSQDGNRMLIGRYEGRQEETYPITVGAGTKGIFVFILQGVFEVANHLLHERDGLALRYAQDDVLEFEALSNEALLLVIEFTEK